MLLWHALEESEHKAVAFDVYRAVGGSERMRIATMRVISFTFILDVVAHATASLLADRATYNLPRLARSLFALRRSPFLSREVVRRVRRYNTLGFHPDDNDNSALLDQWRTWLFGADGALTDHLR